MIILHAGLCDHQVFLWGEVPSPERDGLGEAQPRTAPPARLPYDATPEALADAFAETGSRLPTKQATSLTLWVPTCDGIPLPSSPLIAARLVDEAQPELAAWGVTALPLSSEDAIHFLSACVGRDMLAPGILLGSDVIFFAKVLRFSGALVAREQFLPGLVKRGGAFHARWEPVFIGDDAERLALLSGAMPHACRALTRTLTAPPEDAPAAVLSYITGTFVDYLVRTAWLGKPLSAFRMRKHKTGPFASVHDQWLHALRAWYATMDGDAEELAHLAEQVEAWRRPISVSTRTPFRLSFRLEEPEATAPSQATVETDPGLWYVRYLLQAADDPSLFVEVAEAWHPGKQTTSIFAKRRFNVQEYLLASLGQATSLYPAVEDSLKRPSPGGFDLDTSGAYTFLTETAWLLQQAGYGVQLPAWWTRTGTRQRLSAQATINSPKMQASGGLSLDAIVAFDWQVALGDERLSHGEMEALARLKVPLVKVRGQWVQVDAEAIQAALDFWKKKGEGEITVREVVQMALGMAQAPGGLPFEGVEATGWVGDLLHQLEHGAAVEELVTPNGFEGTLRPYQVRGYSWLAFLQRWGFGACLADDMGLGKAQPLFSKLLTPAGWIRMGEVRVGDEVIGSDGQAYEVVGVFPQGEREIYKVTFTDGSHTYCCDEHLWAVQSPVQKQRGSGFRILPLSAIRERLRDGAGNLCHYVPMVNPVAFSYVDLPVDPYLLGALLGDGGLSGTTPVLSTADEEMIATVAPLLPEGSHIHHKAGYDYRLSSEGDPFAGNPLTASLRSLGLMGCRSEEKHIPDVYLYAHVQARIALLQGLLDTDGHVRPFDNNLEYGSVSKRLANQVVELVQSLGGHATLREKRTHYRDRDGQRIPGRTFYRMSIALPHGVEPFRLTRKASVYKPREKYLPSRGIVSVEHAGRFEAQCIAVNAPDHLYVTDDYILTHNTPQTLVLIQRDWEVNGKQPVLVVCPTSVMGNWQKEAARFTPDLPVLLHHGTRRTKKTAAFKTEARKQAIVITGYPLLHRDFDLLKQIKWGAVVLDEAQNIKNPGTKQAKAARSLKADHRIALTGTPVENNVGELWSIMEFLNPGFLGTQTEFKRRFFLPIQTERDPEATHRLKRLTGPFILRRLKTDKTIIDDLPEKLEMNVFTTLTKEQASLYRAVVKETTQALDESEGIQRKGLVLATLMKLKQICNHPAQFLHDRSVIADRSGKLARLTEMLEEVFEVGDRTLIFTQFTEMGDMIKQHLQETFGREVLFLHGRVPQKQRERMVERFQQEVDGPFFFLLSLKAGGTGLNLTRANHVFHYDRWWNPAVENQATDRAFRIGQTRRVQVHKFVCMGTVEERINEMIERKQEIAESIVGAGEDWITELSTRDLKKLFRLQKEAIGG